MRSYVVTGTTRGIGRAIAERVVAAKDQLLSLSRAPDHQVPYWRNLECDLREYTKIPGKLEGVLRTIRGTACRSIVLINNAGALDPMGPLDDASETQIAEHILVNQAGPAILMAAFIRMTEGIASERRIINVSSGAARHPYAGWAMYCASKAAMDMMTLCVAAEQRDRPCPVSVCSVYPGKVETGMQRQIRQTDESIFPRQPDFVAARDQGELSSASEVAEKILSLEKVGAFENGGIYDLRQMLKF